MNPKMASQLTQTLKKLPFSRTLSRTFSSHKGHLIEVDLTQSQNPASGGLQHLEDAIHTIIVRRLQPDWLPFRPGSSYWAPPPRSLARNLVSLAGKFATPLSNDESLSLLSSNGWPSSNYFLHHDSPPGVEMLVYSQNPESPSESEHEDDDDV